MQIINTTAQTNHSYQEHTHNSVKLLKNECYNPPHSQKIFTITRCILNAVHNMSARQTRQPKIGITYGH